MPMPFEPRSIKPLLRSIGGALLAAVVLVNGVWSHPLAPVLLALDELPPAEQAGAGAQPAPQLYRVTWQLPRSPGAELLEPVLPEGCELNGNVSWEQAGMALRASWKIHCAKPLAGQWISVRGLQNYPGGALLRITLRDGRQYQQLQTGSSESFLIPARVTPAAAFANAAWQGVNHLLGGADHLLFIAVLTLMLGWGRALFWTATLFTLGHSVTLVLASLGWLHLPRQWVDPLIALSIVAACAQLLVHDAHRNRTPTSPLRFRLRRDRAQAKRSALSPELAGRSAAALTAAQTREVAAPSLADTPSRRPWWPAAGFGLLHGMGFANALDAAGVARGDLPLTLAGFNLGIEMGQFMVIMAVAATAVVLRALHLSTWSRLRSVPGYTAGAVAAAWFWGQLAVALQ